MQLTVHAVLPSLSQKLHVQGEGGRNEFDEANSSNTTRICINLICGL